MVTYGVKLERSTALELPRHPEAVKDEENFGSWCARQEKEGRPLAVDLFAGAGGLSWGLEKAGWRVAAAVDIDPHAHATHLANFPGLAIQADLSEPDVLDAFVSRFDGVKVDLVAGGPPCQPFSRAGRSKIRSLVQSGEREAGDSRRELWRVFVEVVSRLRPRAVLMENVPDMGLDDHAIVVRGVISELESLGYEVDVRLLDAWKHRVPQHRRRLFVCARSDGEVIAWPPAASQQVTVRHAIGDLPLLEGTTGSREAPRIPDTELSDFAQGLVEGADPNTVHDHFTRPVRDDDREAFALMNERTLYSDLPEHLRRYDAENFDDKYKRLGWDSLSRTITAHIAKDGYWYIHPSENRTLTVREAARMQSFPDKFRFSGHRSHAFAQIGNAVPPNLAAAVSSALRQNAASAMSENRLDRATRDALRAFAKRERRRRPWLFPHQGRTEEIAIALALLDLRGLPDQVAREAYLRLCAAVDEGSGSIAKGFADFEGALGARRTRTIGELGAVLNRANSDLPCFVKSQRPMTRAVFDNLLGGHALVVSTNALRNAGLIVGCEVERGGADGRILLARIVGASGYSAGLMALLHSATADAMKKAIDRSCV